MAIAPTLEQYLTQHGIQYDLLPHTPTLSSMRTAQASHVPGGRLAKAVLLREEAGYLLAVLAASRHLRLDALAARLNHQVELATEQEIETLFGDCARGALPPIGAAYGVDVIVDDSIAEQSEIYFEGGDHQTLIHMTGAQFAQVTSGTLHGQFSRL
jgi:Ala-tRNA(Pro) deacylase